MNDDHPDHDDRHDRSDGDPFDDVARRAVVALVDRPLDLPPWSAIEDAATRQGQANTRRRVLVMATVAIALVGALTVGLGRARSAPVTYAGGPGDLGAPAVEELHGSDELPDARIEALPESPFGSRDDATAVWTGRELIVWGGSDSTVHGDGAALDRSSGRWRMIAPSPLSPRARHLAVWTGTEMVVWGGTRERSGVGGLLDGAAYDPATDTWRRIADAPSGTDRSSGKAVLVGSRVVIAGGIFRTAPVPVLVYDPATDGWATVGIGDDATSVATSVTAVGSVAVAVTMDLLHRRPARLVGIDPVRASVLWDVPVPQPVAAGVAAAVVTTEGDQAVVLTDSIPEGASGTADETVAWFSPATHSYTRVLHGDHVFDLSLDGQPLAAGRAPIGVSRSRLYVFNPVGLVSIDPATGAARQQDTGRRFCGSYSMASAAAGDDLLVWGGQGTCGGSVSYVGTGATITFG